MQKIIPFLWFNNNAEEAVKFYVSLFKKSKIGDIAYYSDSSSEVSGMKKGSVMTVGFNLMGQEFSALNGGEYYKFSPAVSFFVNINKEADLEKIWKELSNGGRIMMPLGKYPFSKKFGWVQDKFGVSWQLNFTELSEKIIPCLMYVGKQYGKAEEAIKLYTSLFKDSKINKLERHGKKEGEKEGTIKYASFDLAGQEFIAMDSGINHQFGFTGGISFLIDCKDQKEVDHFSDNLSKGGKVLPCAWVEDKYGVVWQVVPSILNELLADKDKKKAENVMAAMLKMEKMDIEGLKKAYSQK